MVIVPLLGLVSTSVTVLLPLWLVVNAWSEMPACLMVIDRYRCFR